MNTEQLLEVLPTYLSLWIWERKPTTGVDAGKLADEYVDARKSSYGASGSTGTGRKVRSNPGRKHIGDMEGVIRNQVRLGDRMERSGNRI